MHDYTHIVISSDHGKHVAGAVGILNEVDEARKVVERLAEELRSRGVDVTVFHDNTSTSQGQNLDTIVSAHNHALPHELDVSVHFNAFDGKAHGTEVLYVSQHDLAAEVSAAIAAAGSFTNRGAKLREDLAFLNGTHEPAILIETCFVDSAGDADLYHARFDEICYAIADVLGGEMEGDIAPPVTEQPPPIATDFPRVDITVTGDVLIYVNGTQVGTKG